MLSIAIFLALAALTVAILSATRLYTKAEKEDVDKLFNVAGKIDAKLVQSVANIAKLLDLHTQATGHEFVDGKFEIKKTTK